jgi:hypothetical protein
LKKIFFFFIILICAQFAHAQDLVGKITEQDSMHTPLFMAEVTQMQDGKTIAIYKTYFDGTYRIKVKPSQTYQLKVSFPGRTDTTVSISVDKHATLYSGTLFISLRRDGLRLTGFILDQIQDIPIKDASIILRNVMTRQEDRFMTDINGSYNLKMDYETNYTLKIDKMSPGIFNKYQDTSFNISTIGFNKPLDFRLDIKLGPTNGYIAPRPEYDPRAKHINRNLKPAFMVFGTKDSVLKRQQDSVIAALNQKLNSKDSLIASLDKRLSDINKAKTDKIALKDMDAEDKKKDEEITRMNQEADSIKLQLADDQKKRDIEKAEADLKAKQLAEHELQAKLNKEIKEAEARKKQQQALAAGKELKEINAARIQAQQDSMLKAALAKNKDMMARRKHIRDSLNRVEDQNIQANNTNADKNNVSTTVETEEYILTDQDSLLKANEIKNSLVMAKRKHVLDSLINIESQRAQVKTDLRTVDDTRMNDSNRIDQALEKESRKKILTDKAQAEQDSTLKIAMTKNNEIMVHRKLIADSLALTGTKKRQAIANAKKLEKEKKEKELADKLKLEQQQQDALEVKQAELAARQRLAAQLKKVRHEADSAAARKTEQQAAARKDKLEKDLAEMKKARQESEAKLLAQKIEKENADKATLKEAKRKTEIETEQHELEAKKALEIQEKTQLAQQLGNLQSNEQAAVTKDQETKQQENNPDQALRNEKANTINAYETQVLQENKKKSDLPTNGADGTPLIKARGYVKNGQTEEPIANVAINIRRLNSIVSQEVTTDGAGRYDILVDSGYFYLVSFYKDKYEISKQILDLTTYDKNDYTIVIQYLKEKDDFDPAANMPIVQYEKNSSKVPAGTSGNMQSIVKMMKDMPELMIKIYGLSSIDENYPMELSITRARLFADLLLENGIKPSRIRINGIGAYRPRSGCTEGKTCTEEQYKQDRVVMYRVVKN